MSPSLKVWITGATGLLGRALCREFSRSSRFDVVATGFSRADENGRVRRLDLTDSRAIAALLVSERPDAIVHAAAERRPDVSEKDPKGTEALNVTATEELARQASRNGARVIYLSTDYVFDGTDPPYRPEDTPRPLNAYGRSKLAGEEALLRHGDHCVLRVPMLYGQVETLDESPVTLLARDLPGASESRQDNWAVRFPTLTDDVAVVCRQLAERGQDESELRGILHWSADEPMTKFDMARRICEIWGLSSDRVVPVDEPPAGAPRPRDARLDCSDLESRGIGRRTPFGRALEMCLKPFEPARRGD